MPRRISNIMQDLFRKIDFFRADSDALVSPQSIIMGLAFGLIIAFIIVYYQRRVIGSFVRAIRYAEATDEETAKTLTELGQDHNISAITKLKKSTSLQSLITICGAVTDAKGKLLIDENTRFYIPKEKEERSRKQFGEGEDSLIPIIIGSIVLLAIVVFAFLLGK